MVQATKPTPKTDTPITYKVVGRFAPSPTGPLHFGSLVSALTSWLQVRSRANQQGRHNLASKWLVRIEDIDSPREVPGAADGILQTLTRLGLTWDDEVLYQSERTHAYQEILTSLQARDLAYACTCSRKDIASHGRQGAEGVIYPGTCNPTKAASRIAEKSWAPSHPPHPPPHQEPSDRQLNANNRIAWRFLTTNETIHFHDYIYGDCKQNVAREIGDFVLKRADNIFAYQLAVVVDDAYQGVTEVVRGQDLLGCTARQIALQQALGYPQPQYFHHPLAVDQNHDKLSKKTHARAIDELDDGETMHRALAFLNQQPPALYNSHELLDWAQDHWQPERISRCHHVVDL